MNSIRGRKAFTLIELIIVIVIIGILAGIAVVGYQAVISKSRVEAAKQTARAFDKDVMALGAFDQQAGNVLANIAIADNELDASYVVTPGAQVGSTGTTLSYTIAKSGCTATVTTSAGVGTPAAVDATCV